MVITVLNAYGGTRDGDALSGFTADFVPGVTAVVGQEGSGKTALLQMLAGRLKPGTGEVLFGGAGIAKPQGRFTGTVGYLSAAMSLPRGQSVEGALLRHAAGSGLERDYARARTAEMLRLLGLNAVKDVRIADCTADVQRRAAIAAVMLPDPELLLLDEPAAGLPPGERMRLNTIFAGLPRGKVTIYTTADPVAAETGLDRVLFMHGGRCLLQAERDRLVAALGGRVWRVAAAQEEAWQIRLSHVVSGQQRVFKEMQLRVVAEAPPEGASLAVPEEPAVRDAYAWCLAKGPDQLESWMRDLS